MSASERASERGCARGRLGLSETPDRGDTGARTADGIVTGIGMELGSGGLYILQERGVGSGEWVVGSGEWGLSGGKVGGGGGVDV